MFVSAAYFIEYDILMKSPSGLIVIGNGFLTTGVNFDERLKNVELKNHFDFVLDDIKCQINKIKCQINKDNLPVVDSELVFPGNIRITQL